MNLYELAGNYLEVLDMITDGDDRYLDTLEALDGAIEHKADNYARVMKTLEMGIEGLKGEEKRLATRRKYMENSVKRMKDSLQNTMIAMDKRKIKSELFTFSIAKNPHRMELLDDTLIPKDYFVPQPDSLDRKKLTDDLKNGLSIDGAKLVQGESLRIR